MRNGTGNLERSSRQQQIVREAHDLMELMFPWDNRSRYDYLGVAMKREGRRDRHLTYMDWHEKLWALALLRNRAWRKGYKTEAGVIYPETV